MKTIIRPMNPLDINACANIAKTGALAEVYGFTERGWIAKLTEALDNEMNILFVAEWEGEVAGFAWVHPRGAFLSSPYLRFIAVSQLYRGKGIGRQLLGEFERQTAHLKRDFILLVSDFNFEAQSLYAKCGYHKIGELPDFVVKGVTEFIMMKKWGIEGA